MEREDMGWDGMGWDGIPSVKVTEIEQNFHFLIPLLDDICFLCRAKAKLLLRGLTKALKSKQSCIQR